MNDGAPSVTYPASRILIIDDNPGIHDDFRKIFGASRERSSPSAAELALFGSRIVVAGVPEFEIESAYQGEEGLVLVQRAQAQQTPYAMAFVDVRMPPGWDGIETTARIWEQDADIQIVICTAYSDYSWSEMLAKLGRSDRLVILKKPFDTIEVVQLASALTEKWRLARQSRSTMGELERRVAQRTSELALAADRLQASETQYRLLFDSNPHPMWVYDAETLRFVTVNGAAVEHYGYSEQQFRAMTVNDIRQTQGVAMPADHADVLRGQGKAFVRLCHRKHDGSLIDVEVSSDGIVFDGRRARLVLAHDVTERNDADVKIKRLNRVYAVLSGIDSLIVRVRDRQGLFDGACRIAVEQGNFGMAWIGVFDPEAQEVTPVAWAGESAAELSGDKASTRDDPPHGQGAIGRVVRGGRLLFNNDITADSLIRPRLLKIVKAGFRSQITLPLFEAEAIVGTLTLYARELNFFDAEELRLLGGLAADISFALESISRRHKLDKLSRIRAVSSEINAAIVRIHDRQPLLEQMCRIVREHGKFELIWIGAIDHDLQQVEPMAWSGFSEETARSITWGGINNIGGCLGEAIRNGKPAVRNAAEVEVPEGRLRQEALRQGCPSTLCLPLMVGDIVAAVIVLCAPGHGFFDNEELELLNEVGADISFALEAIEKRKKLEYLSYYDVLTGLANRSLFLERVAQYVRIAASDGHKLALYLVDLERFKNINDSLGQAAGDALLRQVADWLTRTVGDASLLARVDADHFAVVMPQVKHERGVAHLLEKQLAAFLDHPFRLNESVFRIAAKVGVALFPEDGGDADTLFKNTEAALKQAKGTGERYLFFTPKMTEAVAGRVTMENQLRQAIHNEEFVLHYQPKINLTSGLVTSAEALIRWNDPRTGLVPPARFIPILEETGLICEVGRWALRTAIEDYLRWCAAGLAAVRIAVNVSPLQLRNRGFIAEIEKVLGVEGHAAAGLELEITESLIMEDVKHNIASLHAIRAMGVTIAIDDFGTGFSSLSYLAKLPVDTLKIDRSFVIDMTGTPEGLALVSTIINLAHSLKLKVVAEGVETDEQSRLLRLLGCDEMQGFLFSRPTPGDMFRTHFLAPASTAPPQHKNRRTTDARHMREP